MALTIIRGRKNQNINFQDHFGIEEHDDYIQVKAGEESYRFSLEREDFQKRYLADWRRLNVTSPVINLGGEEILFGEGELFNLKQKIILHWILVGVKGSLNHAQTWDIVRSAAIDKYGYGNLKSDTAAAAVLGISTEEYTKWRTDREAFERRW